jgi:hypothetical protein
MFKAGKTVSNGKGEVAVLQMQVCGGQVVPGIVVAGAEVTEEMVPVISTVDLTDGAIDKTDLFGVETVVV